MTSPSKYGGLNAQPTAPRKPAPKKPAPKPAPKKPTSTPIPLPQRPGYATESIDATPAGTFDNKGEPAGGLIGPLKLPAGLNAASTFVWDYKTWDKGPHGAGQSANAAEHANGGQSQTTMTVAGSLSWLKQLAANDKDHYNMVVHQLVAAGYMSPSEARYNSYSIQVGNKFLQSVADTWAINHDQSGQGTTVRWVDHINDMIQGRIDSGQIDADGNPLDSSGGGRQGPVRQDRWSDPETVKAAINNAARDILGRKLTDSEVASFASAFHGQEQSYNDKKWAADQAAAAGNASSVVDSPNVNAAAKNYEESNPAQTQERTTQLLGSYIGVLRNLTGNGSGGVANAVR